MLKKINRLRVSRHFKRAYEKGQSLSGRFVKVKAFKNFRQNSAPAKVAVVISKKIAPHAVERNLWRRRTKAVMKEEITKFPGWEIVISFNGAIKSADFNTLKEDLIQCLKKLPSS